MKKLVLGTIRKKKVASGTPFTNMRKDYPPQKEKVKSQTKYKPWTLLKEEAIKVKKQETYKNTYFSCHNKHEYGNTFNGYCFPCKNFGHKELECKSLEKKISTRSIT